MRTFSCGVTSVEFVLDWITIAWRLALPLLIGSSVGALMGYYWVDMISIAFLPMIAGIVILIVTWVPLPSALVTWDLVFYLPSAFIKQALAC